jgi:two-component system response regulator HydG
VVDDDVDMCSLLLRFLTRNGFEVSCAHTGKSAVDILPNFNPDLVLCDYRLDDMTGTYLISKFKAFRFQLPVIIITGYSDIKTAVEVMKTGATDYVTKPLFPDEILLTINKILNADTSVKPSAVQKKNDTQKNSNYANKDYVFGNSLSFNKIIEQIKRVTPTNYTVIIYGESGSGKEVIAKEIHRNSKRSGESFQAVDCGALSKELAASELFGHEKGSFTGAVAEKKGIFEVANGGTVFLDEIANLSYDVQVSLLRVVQERKMRRVGGLKDIDLDVRIIVASNEKLLDAAKKGKFREDLYHRFNEFSIDVPPLKERREDILMFAGFFLEKANEELEKDINGLSAEVANIFKNYVWPGNLREMKNVIKRAALLTDGIYIETSSLPFELVNYSRLQFDVPTQPYTNYNNIELEPQQPINTSQPPINNYQYSQEPVIIYRDTPTVAPVVFDIPLQPQKQVTLNEKSLRGASLDAEYETIVSALKAANFNKSKAAKILNVDRKTLYNKMRQFKEFNNEL